MTERGGATEAPPSEPDSESDSEKAGDFTGGSIAGGIATLSRAASGSLNGPSPVAASQPASLAIEVAAPGAVQLPQPLGRCTENVNR
eukprot:5837317-Alexandrium_andersonii.AAC.1